MKNFSACGYYDLKKLEYQMDIIIPDIPKSNATKKYSLNIFNCFPVKIKNILALFIILRHYADDREDYSNCPFSTKLNSKGHLNAIIHSKNLEKYIVKNKPLITLVPIHEEDIDFRAPKNKKVLSDFISANFKKPKDCNNPGYNHKAFTSHIRLQIPKHDLEFVEAISIPKTIGPGGVLRPIS